MTRLGVRRGGAERVWCCSDGHVDNRDNRSVMSNRWHRIKSKIKTTHTHGEHIARTICDPHVRQIYRNHGHRVRPARED